MISTKASFQIQITLGVRFWLMFEERIQPTAVDLGGLQGVNAEADAWLACLVKEIWA